MEPSLTARLFRFEGVCHFLWVGWGTRRLARVLKGNNEMGYLRISLFHSKLMTSQVG